MPSNKCWICASTSEIKRDGNSILYFDCSRCGRYRAERNLIEDNQLNGARLIANISGWIFENPNFLINDNSVLQKLKNILTPNVNEKANKLLTWLNDKTNHLGELIPVKTTEIKLWAITWSMNKSEINYLTEYLKIRNFIKKIDTGVTDQFQVEILPDGFTYLNDLQTKIQSDIGFCAMSFADELLPTWTDAILPAIQEAGYQPVRIDSEQYNTGIVDQIKSKIRQSKFIVADLTMHRQGVYYEAGFADGLGRGVIFTCRNDEFEKKHFDVQHINIIKWNANQYQNFKNQLRWRIEATIGSGKKS